jgi:hypothetical protein
MLQKIQACPLFVKHIVQFDKKAVLPIDGLFDSEYLFRCDH